jgi:DNA repair exonuclease SbcCD ATPase subunit
MPEPYVDGVKIDELSQSVMWLLRDADTKRCASALAEQLQDADTSKVRHRFDKLQRVDFIDHVDSVENPGAQNATKYYDINERGLEWLYEHQETAEDAVGRKRYLDSLDQLREMVMDTRDDFRELQAALEALEDDLDDDLQDLNESLQQTVDQKVKGLETRLDELEGEIESVETDLERLDRFETRLHDLETELDGINLGRLEQRQHELVERVNTNYFLLARAWRRTFYNAREMQRLNLAKVAASDADPTMGDEQEPPMFEDVDQTDADLTAPEDDPPRP